MSLIDLRMSCDEFFAQQFERAPRLIQQGLTAPLPAWHDLDHALHGIEPDDQALQLFLDGMVASEHYAAPRREQGETRRVIDKHRFYALLHRGATLVLNRFERHSLLTQHLCDELARFTGISTSCNSYVSWTGSGSFGKHWDTHDVFVVQLIGKKRWRIFAPTLPLPLAQHTSRSSGMQCPATPVMELELHAGDVLYVPRGWWHEVTPLHAGSWHLSIGVYTPTVADYTSWICQHLLARLPAMRASARKQPDAAASAEIAHALQTALQQSEQFAAFLRSQQTAQPSHGDFNMELFMSGPGSNDAVQVMRATASGVDPNASELTTVTGTLRMDPLKRELLALLNSHHSLSLHEILLRLPHHPANHVRDTVWQLAVMEVLSLRAA